ncbi:hypothetical protein HO675_06780 [Streptococcus suis]|nr:hypothetical protein [Streptococcus suis]
MNKSFVKTLSLSLLASLFLTACSTTSKQESGSGSSTSQTSSQTTTSSTEATSTTSSSTSSSSSETQTDRALNLDAIAAGDFSSLTGTWMNSQGNVLVFDKTGLVSEDAFWSGEFMWSNGLLTTNVQASSGVGGYALVLVPKGMAIPSEFFADGPDPSDQTKDRLFGAQNVLSTQNFAPFYRVSTELPHSQSRLETSVTLDSGQVSIDYATEKIGDKAWIVLEGNYTRTESVPYNLLQGSDGSLIWVYQNGVIYGDNNQLLYTP